MIDRNAFTSSHTDVISNEDRGSRSNVVLGDDASSQQFSIAAARLLSNSHCEDVIIYNVQGLSDVTSYIVIASGTSDRQMRSVADEVKELCDDFGLAVFGEEVDQSTTWLVVDMVDVVVHLFESGMRAHYDLEMLWGDAPHEEWQP